ncbi:MAG: hypothetical protein ABJX94_03160 [Flavobacteriaceae bacterium]
MIEIFMLGYDCNIFFRHLDRISSNASEIILVFSLHYFIKSVNSSFFDCLKKNDSFFVESRAVAFKKDVKTIVYTIYNSSHFALEEGGGEIIDKIRVFMKKKALK